MFLTFTKNEFINKFNEEGFGNTPPPASISKLISRFHVYRVFEEIWSSKSSGYYARFNNNLTTLVAFSNDSQSNFSDVQIFQDLLKQLDGIYGEFFFSQRSLSFSPIHFSQWSVEVNNNLVPTVEDWKRVVQLEDGLFFDDNQNHRLTSVPWSQKIARVADSDDPTSCYKYVVCQNVTDHNVAWAFSSGCCLIIKTSSRINWFSHWIIPFVHYFPSDNDFDKVIHWLIENDEAARKVAKNGYDFYQSNLTKNGVLSNLQLTLQRSNYRCPPFKFKVNSLPTIPDFLVSWCGINPVIDHVVDLKYLSVMDQKACLVQTMVLFQNLQWNYLAYLSRFRIICQKIPAKFECRDINDHFFNMKHTIYILIEGPVYYVDLKSQKTNYQEILHNYQDVLKVFGSELTQELECTKETFKQCLNYFYLKVNNWLPQNVYSRRPPIPVCRLNPSSKIMAHPLPFDNNTNKLVIYRQYQLYAPALTNEYSRAFHEILKKKCRDNVTFDIIDFEAYDWWKLQYDESESIPNINIENDTDHLRVVTELINVISPIDKPHYLKMFQPLLDLDKVIYSIRYAQLKTISVEQ